MYDVSGNGSGQCLTNKMLLKPVECREKEMIVYKRCRRKNMSFTRVLLILPVAVSQPNCSVSEWQTITRQINAPSAFPRRGLASDGEKETESHLRVTQKQSVY